METAVYLLAKAEQCRRLAANIVGDPLHDVLIKLAEEFEANAATCIAREKTAHVSAVGEDALGVVEPYHVCFRNRHTRAIGRDDFFAPNDAHAIVVARTLADACSDLCTGFELWQNERQVDYSEEQKLSGVHEIALKVQGIVLERELVLRESESVIASSTRLLEETDRLLQRLRG